MNEANLDALRILRDALDTDPDGRDEYLSTRCGADARLRERVDALLCGIADAELDGASPAGQDAGVGQISAHEDPLIGSLLGPFRVVELVGRGGMGIVYRGEREGADFRQQVALKLIRRGFDFDDIRARFLRERRILARLSHPNLARFIDGGVAGDGRPWFALEFVRGETITRWCDQRKLDIRARVRLFLHVCSAVQYAHTQLVVHRDLKPGNVLVEGTGTVRLLDFGIARLLSGDDAASGEHPTLMGNIALTPEFASPEQMAGAEVGIATDVFALGVLLYLLIADAFPYDVQRADLGANRWVAYDKPPTPLAHALVSRCGRANSQRSKASDSNASQESLQTPELASVAARHNSSSKDHPAQDLSVRHRLDTRSMTLGAYQRAVRGDLTRIVETAVAREPERRYQTVAAFADDLQRWLVGAPVRVSGNRFSYRFRKFARRNAAAVAVATMLTVALLGATASALRNAASERLQRDVASKEAARTLQIKDQLIQIFLQPEDADFGSGVKTANEFLDQAAARLQMLPIGSAVRGELAGVLVGIYLNLSQSKRALTLAETELGGAPITAERTTHADLRLVTGWTVANWFGGRIDGIAAPLASAIARAADTHTKIYADAVLMQTRLAIQTGDFANAVQLAQHALTVYQEIGANRTEIVNARMELAAAYVGDRKPSKGREQSEMALREAGNADSMTHVHATTMAGLRRALFGDFASAQAVFDDGAAQWRRLGLRIRSPFEKITYAVNQFDLGDLDRATLLISGAGPSALQIEDGKRQVDIIERPWLLGEIALHRSQHHQAASLFSQAALLAREGSTRLRPSMRYMLALEAVALTRAGDFVQAREVIGIAQSAKSSSQPDFATSMQLGAQAVLHSAQKDHATALKMFDQALAELAAARKEPAVLEDQLKENRDALRLQVWKAQAQFEAGELDSAALTASTAWRLGIATLGVRHPFMRELDDLQQRLPSADLSQSAGSEMSSPQLPAKSDGSTPDAS